MEINTLKDKALQKGIIIFDNDYKDCNLNLWGVRNNSSSNKFDDKMFVFWKHNGIWTIKEYKITTDPGRYYLKHPMSSKGTGALVEGQHFKSWAIGKHQGKYDALVQVKPLPCYRDNNKDEILKLDPKTIEIGNWGCNIHRSNEKAESYFIDNWSAMCQVFAKGSDFKEFMNLCYTSRENFGNSFTYTLI